MWLQFGGTDGAEGEKATFFSSLVAFVDERLEESVHNILSALLVLITHQEMGSVRGGGGLYWGSKLLELSSEDQTQAQPANDQRSNWSS